MTCDEVRERLPDHLLGTLSDADVAALDGHLRGCAACRSEAAGLGEGLAAFASAAHDRTPPDELRTRVEDVLRAEWASASSVRALPTVHRQPRASWMVYAAAAIALVLALTWGFTQRHDARVAAAQGSSYTNLLHILGGKEFRAGTLQASAGQALQGSVVVYDSHEDQSWAAVFVRNAAPSSDATATLQAPDGRTVDIWPLQIASDGAGAAWVVTAADLTAFDRVTVRDGDGTVIATAQLHAA